MRTFSYKGKEVYLQVSEYVNNPMGIAIQMYDAATGEPIDTVTKNLGIGVGNESLLSIYCNFIDDNNNGKEIIDFLTDNNLAEPYTRFGDVVTKQSNFVEYPLYAFNPATLRSCDPSGCAEYEESYQRSFQKERQNLLQESRDFFSSLEWNPEKDFYENSPWEPIGRIEFLGLNGEVMEVVDYTNAIEFEKDIKAENYVGTPMSVVLYRDREGGTIPHEFIYDCDPPLQGFSIEDCPVIDIDDFEL